MATRAATIVGSAAVPNRRGRFIQPIGGGDREPCRARGDRCTDRPRTGFSAFSAKNGSMFSNSISRSINYTEKLDSCIPPE